MTGRLLDVMMSTDQEGSGPIGDCGWSFHVAEQPPYHLQPWGGASGSGAPEHHEITFRVRFEEGRTLDRAEGCCGTTPIGKER